MGLIGKRRKNAMSTDIEKAPEVQEEEDPETIEEEKNADAEEDDMVYEED